MHPQRLAALSTLFVTSAIAAESIVYIGTYTRKESKGIYAFRFEDTTGKMTPLGLVAETPSPSFLAIHPSGKFLYAVNEVDQFEGEKSGSITAFSIDRASGKLTQLNAVSSKGRGPCHLNVDAKGQTLLVANYGGGSIASYGIGADGKLSAAVSSIQHTGSSVNKGRQSEPHAHSINIDEKRKLAVVADLGLDKVFFYGLDSVKHTLTATPKYSVSTNPGSGPRHFAFDPKGKYGYVINEMQSTVSVIELGGAEPRIGQSVSTLPTGYDNPRTSTAEVRVHPSGKFLYGSNRGHDSIAMFSIDKGGSLKTLGHAPVQGKTPRNFTVDPSGKFLLVANQDSDNLVLFQVQTDGILKPTGTNLPLSMPVCVRFLSLSKR